MSEIDGIQFLIGLCAGVLIVGIAVPASVDAWLAHKWQQAVNEYKSKIGDSSE